MNNVRFILKNGCEFVVKCKNARVTTTMGEITGYSLTGCETNRPLYVCLEQIAAIIDEGTATDDA